MKEESVIRSTHTEEVWCGRSPGGGTHCRNGNCSYTEEEAAVMLLVLVLVAIEERAKDLGDLNIVLPCLRMLRASLNSVLCSLICKHLNNAYHKNSRSKIAPITAPAMVRDVCNRPHAMEGTALQQTKNNSKECFQPGPFLSICSSTAHIFWIGVAMASSSSSSSSTPVLLPTHTHTEWKLHIQRWVKSFAETKTRLWLFAAVLACAMVGMRKTIFAINRCLLTTSICCCCDCLLSAPPSAFTALHGLRKDSEGLAVCCAYSFHCCDGWIGSPCPQVRSFRI